MRHVLVAAALVLVGCGTPQSDPELSGSSASPPAPVSPPSSTSPAAPAPSDSEDPSASGAAAPADVAALPACAALFRPGTDVRATPDLVQCQDANGEAYIVGLFRCHDGTHLGSVDPTSGAPRGWFRAPGPFHVIDGEAATDPAYGAQYRTCTA